VPTVHKLEAAIVNAQSLHSQLSTFALDALDPAARSMWTSQAMAAEQIMRSIQDRRDQLQRREETMRGSQNTPSQPGD